MPYKYLKIGNKYYSQQGSAGLGEISESDIRGKMGDISSATYQRFGVQQGDWLGMLNNPDFSGGGVLEVNPGELSLGKQTAPTEPYPVLYNGSRLTLAGSGADIKNTAQAQALGISGAGLPAGQVPIDQDFANYLKQTGQTYAAGQFSGSPTITGTKGYLAGQPPGGTQPQTLATIQDQANKYVDPNAVGAYTPPQATNGFNAYYKDAQGNVFRASDNKPVTMGNSDPSLDWNKLGLNVAHINTKQGITGQTGTLGVPAQPGAVSGTTGASGGQNASPPSLTGTDFASYYANLTGIPEVAKEKQEYETSKVAGEAVYQAGITAKQTLIDQSQKLFNDLWDSPDIQVAKADKEKAFAELNRIDTEEKAVTQKIKQGQIPGWAMSGQLRLTSESYNVQRATYAANYAIANDKLTEAKDYATKAYDAGVNVLNAKIKLVEDTLSHSKDLTATEKSEYEDILSQAKTYLETRKKEADTATDLYLSLASKGVGGITPNMSEAELIKIAGPVLAKIAQDEIVLNKKNTESLIADRQQANIKGISGQTFSTELNSVVDDIYSGRYTREQGIEILKRDFPNSNIDFNVVYQRVPDNYEQTTAYKGTKTNRTFQDEVQSEMIYAQQLKDAGFSRKDIEKQYGTNPIPLAVKGALDQVYK